MKPFQRYHQEEQNEEVHATDDDDEVSRNAKLQKREFPWNRHHLGFQQNGWSRPGPRGRPFTRPGRGRGRGFHAKGSFRPFPRQSDVPGRGDEGPCVNDGNAWCGN